MKKLKILICIPSFSVGGAENFVLKLVEKLNEKEYVDISVCCINNLGPLSLQLQKDKVEINTLNKRNPLDIFTFIRAYKLIKRIKPDIVHTFLPTSGIWMSIPSYLAGVKVKIYGVRSSSDNLLWWVDKLERTLIIPFVNIITFVSDDSSTSFLRRYNYPKQKAFVIRNGVDIEKFSNYRIYNNQSKLIITFVGRLVEVKGVDILIRAFSRLLIVKPYAKLWLVGDGKLRKNLMALAQELNVSRSVEFLGERLDIPSVLSQSDIYVSTSNSEGIPNAHLEAMASGLPIVASRVGGVSEILDDQTAFLIPPGDEDAVVEGVLKFADNPTFANAIGHNAQKKVANEFSIAKMIEEYDELYKKMMIEVY